MNTPASAPAPRTVAIGQVLIRGRILSRRSITTQQGKLWLTLVAMPAPDPYSHPATVEVKSDKALGQSQDDVEVLCRLGGSRRTFQVTDKETGERLTVATADNSLTAVEG